jgi:hypothetical protein
MGYTVRRPFPRLHLFLHPPTRDLEGTEPSMLFLPTTGLSLPTQQVSLAQRGSSARRQYLVVVLVLLIAPSWRSSSTHMLPPDMYAEHHAARMRVCAHGDEQDASWRQHTAARMRVCAHGDRQKVPDGVVVEEQQHMPLLRLYSSRQGDSTQLLVCVDTCTATNKTYPVVSPRKGEQHKLPPGESQYKLHPLYIRSTPRRQRTAARMRVCAHGDEHPVPDCVVRGGAAAHAAPRYIRRTSWRQHTAARTRVCVRGDTQARPAASSWRSTMTEYSQICAQHIMETAHRDSYARMRTRRQAKGTRWCHRGGAAAHAALESVLITSRR